MAVAALDAAQAFTANGSSYAVSDGENRLLTVCVGMEPSSDPGGAPTVTGTYGGQNMTLAEEFYLAAASGIDLWAGLFILKEDGLDAASGSTITLTGLWAAFHIHARSYSGVDQTTPIKQTNEGGQDAATPNPVIVDLTGVVAGSAVLGFSVGNSTSTHTWAAPLTERTDLIGGGTTSGSIADGFFAAGQDVTVRSTLSGGQTRLVSLSAEIQQVAAPAFTQAAYQWFDGSSGVGLGEPA